MNLTDTMKTTEGPFSAASGFFDSGKGKDAEVALENAVKAVVNFLEDQERRFPWMVPNFSYVNGFLTRRDHL
jgi:hypothetical protein